jgi:uncharacterized protein YbbC (DUF1343 family)
MVKTGLDRLKASTPSFLKSGRIGLLVHPASVDSRLVHCRQIFSSLFGDRLKALFNPQHGIYGEKQDNMVESPDSFDAGLGIPVFSLYSHVRRPTTRMLADIDVMVIDLQDVGTRVYTFIHTMAHCMMVARETGIKVVVLDRPNPIGGKALEGNLLKPEYTSFVGMYPIPMRHAMTIGELALLFNDGFGIGCDLEVVPMGGWRRRMYFHDTGLPWVIPSPNLPTVDAAMVYPGQVLLEGTNVSEGRGTTRPFELFGAPFIDPGTLEEQLRQYELTGVFFRRHHFAPNFQKWSGEVCRGFQIHVTDPTTFRPYRTTLAILQSLLCLYPDRFAWTPPPYEYEEVKLPIDILTGDPGIREALSELRDLGELEEGWEEDLSSFRKQRQSHLLYKN